MPYIRSLLALSLVLVSPRYVPADDADQQPPNIQIEVQVVGDGVVQVFSSVAIGGVGSPLGLLRNASVQEHLKLTDEQKTQIQGAFDDLNEQRRQLYEELRDVPAEQRAQKTAEIQKLVQQLTDETSQAMRSVLTPEQARRLEQILLQQQGLRALSDAKIAEQLKLTEDQQRRIAEVRSQSEKKRQNLVQQVAKRQIKPDEYQARLQELNTQTETDTLDVLTKQQREQFQELQGEKFEFRKLAFEAVPLPARVVPVPKAP